MISNMESLPPVMLTLFSAFTLPRPNIKHHLCARIKHTIKVRRLRSFRTWPTLPHVGALRSPSKRHVMRLSQSLYFQGSHVLLQHIYKEHPPQRGSLDATKLGGNDLKDTLKQAILHYHPDKQVRGGRQGTTRPHLTLSARIRLTLRV